MKKIVLKKFIRVPRSKEKSMIEKGDYETHCCGFIEWQPEEVESIAISETTIELHGSQGASSADAARSPQTAETIIAVARKNGVIEIARKTKKYFLGEVCSLFPHPFVIPPLPLALLYSLSSALTSLWFLRYIR